MGKKRLFSKAGLAVLFFITLSLSCYEDAVRDNLNDPRNFSTIYPDNGAYGENLLKEGTMSISPGIYCSIHLKKTGNNTVTVIVPQDSSFYWAFVIGPATTTGWNIRYENSSQIFTAEGPGTFDVKIHFYSPASGGYGEIEVYEGGSSVPSRVVVRSW